MLSISVSIEFWVDSYHVLEDFLLIPYVLMFVHDVNPIIYFDNFLIWILISGWWCQENCLSASVRDMELERALKNFLYDQLDISKEVQEQVRLIPKKLRGE